MGFGGIAFSMWVPCLVQAQLSARLPTSYLVVPILMATQEIHHGTCIVSHVVGHYAPNLHQVNKVLPLWKVLFSMQNILEK